MLSVLLFAGCGDGSPSAEDMGAVRDTGPVRDAARDGDVDRDAAPEADGGESDLGPVPADSGPDDGGATDAGTDLGIPDGGPSIPPSIPVDMPRAPIDTTLAATANDCSLAPVLDSTMGSTLVTFERVSGAGEVLCSAQPSSLVDVSRPYRLRLQPGQSASYVAYLTLVGLKGGCGEAACVEPLIYRRAIRNEQGVAIDVDLAVGYDASLAAGSPDGQVVFRYGDANSSDCSMPTSLPLDTHLFAQAPGAPGTPSACGIAEPAYYSVTVPPDRTLVVWWENEQDGNGVDVQLREGCGGPCVPQPGGASPFDDRAFFTNTTGVAADIHVIAGTTFRSTGRYFRLYASLF
jgi:hypothetical protein